jgi:hypothetical protein
VVDLSECSSIVSGHCCNWWTLIQMGCSMDAEYTQRERVRFDQAWHARTCTAPCWANWCGLDSLWQTISLNFVNQCLKLLLRRGLCQTRGECSGSSAAIEQWSTVIQLCFCITFPSLLALSLHLCHRTFFLCKCLGLVHNHLVDVVFWSFSFKSMYPTMKSVMSFLP